MRQHEVVLPVGKNIRIQITAADVIHAWTVPSFGIKHDAVPGRVNESWFNIDRPGIYYGQCSELCGTAHAYMPIKVRAVTQAEYDAWVAEAQAKFAKVDGSEPEGTSVAAAETATVATSAERDAPSLAVDRIRDCARLVAFDWRVISGVRGLLVQHPRGLLVQHEVGRPAANGCGCGCAITAVELFWSAHGLINARLSPDPTPVHVQRARSVCLDIRRYGAD